jgi:hypothetical protein
MSAIPSRHESALAEDRRRRTVVRFAWRRSLAERSSFAFKTFVASMRLDRGAFAAALGFVDPRIEATHIEKTSTALPPGPDRALLERALHA